MGRHHYSLQISFCFCYHSSFSHTYFNLEKKIHGLTFSLPVYGLDKFSPINELNKDTYLPL